MPSPEHPWRKTDLQYIARRDRMRRAIDKEDQMSESPIFQAPNEAREKSYKPTTIDRLPGEHFDDPFLSVIDPYNEFD